MAAVAHNDAIVRDYKRAVHCAVATRQSARPPLKGLVLILKHNVSTFPDQKYPLLFYQILTYSVPNLDKVLVSHFPIHIQVPAYL